MFTTLIRFDNVYHTHFMCNVRQIREYDNLWPYLRDLYQTSVGDQRDGYGVADTVDMDHIKEHYYTTHPDVTPHGSSPADRTSTSRHPTTGTSYRVAHQTHSRVPNSSTARRTYARD